MLRHAVSSNKFALVCSKRPKCYARGYIAVVGDSIKIVKKGLTYTVDADEEDLLKIENYGETLLHTHTAHCKGRSFFAIFFQILSEKDGLECKTTRHKPACYKEGETFNRRIFRHSVKEKSVNNSLPAGRIVDVSVFF